MQSKLVYGENIQQTMQFAQTGDADVAIVAMSLAVVAPEGDWVALSEGDYAPIDQGDGRLRQRRRSTTRRALVT